MERGDINIVVDSLVNELISLKSDFINRCQSAEMKLNQLKEILNTIKEKDDKIIEERKEERTIEKRIKDINYWKNNKECEIIYDSDYNGFNKILFNKSVMNKNNLIFLLFIKEKVFGISLNKPITLLNQFIEDESMYIFTIQLDGTLMKIKKKRTTERWKNSIELFSTGSFLFCISWAFGITNSGTSSWFHEKFKDYYTNSLELPAIFDVSHILVFQNKVV
ncbi:hypothetical protein ENUP19_0100G0006 [Entamoeba nuttalli]|uniref:TLDc domain-containing protein n=2 Tax=Entamoeba nuttalli TaxID=412467 RepID=K2GHL4_ENTNP|nr:hypothetical protein ENU1_030010 [Entamoeba nuttalli P19]EKE42176.1 hypothetical protein ENU1_030010 [Entamoeba nuttalli P19]|eukprot:XP_008855491.1 hypothetical protein ENU1_030010 [Entamoeba nuttalli P19]